MDRNQNDNYNNKIGKIFFRIIGIIFLLTAVSSLAAGFYITNHQGIFSFGIIFFIIGIFCFSFFIWCLNPKRNISDFDFSI